MHPQASQRPLDPEHDSGQHMLIPDCFDLAELWMAASADPSKLDDALQAMARFVGATAAKVLSVPINRGPALCLAVHPGTNTPTDLQPVLSRSAIVKLPRGQALLLMSDLDASATPSTHQPPSADVGIVVLQRSGMGTVLLELHLPHIPDGAQSTLLMQAATFAKRTWQPEVQISGSTDVSPSGSSVIGPLNNYKLTPSETRICKLLGQGYSPIQIADQLGLSIETIRTHLKGAFAKTGTSGQRELIFLIHGQRTTEDAE